MGKTFSKKEKKKIKDSLVIFLSTSFLTGYAPSFPGTIGALLAIPFFILLGGNPRLFLSFTLLVIFLSFFIIKAAEKTLGEDSQRINLDEFSGMLVTYLFLKPSFLAVITGFLFFRIFDIHKFPPINIFERIKNGGVLLDDLIAGGMANIATRIFLGVTEWPG